MNRTKTAKHDRSKPMSSKLSKFKFLVDNISIEVYRGRKQDFRRTISILMGTDSALLLANLFLLHYD